MRTLIHRFLLAASCATVLTHVAFGGGAEHFCPQPGAEVTEYWTVPPTGVPFEIASLTNANGQVFAPNYPNTAANLATGALQSQWPVIQSVIGALNAWNGFTAGGQAVSTFAFSGPRRPR